MCALRVAVRKSKLSNALYIACCQSLDVACKHSVASILIPSDTKMVAFVQLPLAIIKLPACLTLLTLETYNKCFIASKLLTVADHAAILIPTCPAASARLIIVDVIPI